MSVTKACSFMDISRQAYYKQCTAQVQRDTHEQRILRFIKLERIYQPRIGTRKLKYLLSLQQLFIGRDRLFKLLASHQMLVSRQRAYHKTTNSHHHFTCHPNLVKEGLSPEKPEQLWVADITYLPTISGNNYLSLITDAFSRKVVGYHVDDNMKADSVKLAYSQALGQRKTNTVLKRGSVLL